MHQLLTNMKKFKTITSLGVLLALLAVLIGPPLQIAQAAALTGKKDTMSSLKASTASNHQILFTTPTGVASLQTITLTLTSFSVAAALDFEDLDLSEDTTPDGVCDTGDTEEALVASAPSASQWTAVRTSATVITFTSGGASAIIAAASEVCVEVGTGAESGVTGTEQITNPSTGSYTLAIGGTMADSGSVAISILADDQVAVSGTVSESMTFSLGATSVALGTLSTSAVTSGSHTVTLATNAASGLVLTYSGTTLTSGGNTITAMSTAAASAIGTEQFGINAKDNATPNVGAECSGTAPIAAAATGYSTADSFKFVTGETIISSAAGINSTSCTLSYIANIEGATEAGSYTTTLTYTATATF